MKDACFRSFSYLETTFIYVLHHSTPYKQELGFSALTLLTGLLAPPVFQGIVSPLHTLQYPLLKGTRRASLLEEGVIEERGIAVADIPLYENVYLINALLNLGETKCSIDDIES